MDSQYLSVRHRCGRDGSTAGGEEVVTKSAGSRWRKCQLQLRHGLGGTPRKGRQPGYSLFQKIFGVAAGRSRGKFALGVAEFGSGDYEAAKRDLTEAAARKETVAGAEYFLRKNREGRRRLEIRGGTEARSIAADPVYADSHAELALARIRLGDVEGARKELTGRSRSTGTAMRRIRICWRCMSARKIRELRNNGSASANSKQNDRENRN